LAISEDLSGFAPIEDNLRQVFRERVATFATSFRSTATAAPYLDRADRVYEG